MADPFLTTSRRILKQANDPFPLPLCGIYAIRNRLTGERYVGSSTQMRARTGSHRTLLRKGVHHSRRLQDAWDSCGESAFVYETLALCRPARLLEIEQFWLDHFDSYVTGYNQSPTAGSIKGTKRPQSAIDANRAFLTGRPRSLETIAKMKGRKHSPERCARMSAALKGHKGGVGRPVSAETRAKIGAANKAKRA